MRARIIIVPFPEWQAERALANLSGDARAALVERWTDPKRPGPSPSRQKAKASLAARITRVSRELYPDASLSLSARLMAVSARRYAADVWPRARASAAPKEEPAATWYCLLSDEGAVPSARTIRRYLAKN